MAEYLATEAQLQQEQLVNCFSQRQFSLMKIDNQSAHRPNSQ